MQVEVGAVVEGTVTGITKFGAFVSLPDGRSGLVHISEIANTYVNDVNEFLKLGDKVKVRVLAITPDGKINLSIKKAEPAPERPNNRPMTAAARAATARITAAHRAPRARTVRPSRRGRSAARAGTLRLKTGSSSSCRSRTAAWPATASIATARAAAAAAAAAADAETAYPSSKKLRPTGRSFFHVPLMLSGRRYLIRTKHRTGHRHAPLGSDCPQLRTPAPVLQQWKRLQKGKHKYIMSILRCAYQEIPPKRRRSEIQKMHLPLVRQVRM